MTAAPAGELKAPEANNPFEENETTPSTAENGTENTAPEGQSTTEPDEPGPPSKTAPKADWVAYAEIRGIDSSGTVKEIQARVSGDHGEPKEAEVDTELLAEVKHEHLPLSAVVGDVFGIVKVNPAGIVVLEVSMHGFIGVEPVAVPVEQASDIEKVVQTLRDQAASL